MAEAVPVRCPACLRENGYAAPVFPCACGSPVTPPLDLAAPPLPLTHRTWSDTWVAVRCTACGRVSEWPHPELGCASCGTVVRIAVHPVDTGAGSGTGLRDGLPARPGVRGQAREADPGRPGAPGAPGLNGPAGVTGPAGTDGTSGPSGPSATSTTSGTSGPAPGQPPAAPVPRPAFRPVTIRTARDAVATAALYLRWLGFQDVRQPDGRPIPAAAVDLRAPGLVAQVDPTTAPAGLRAVECVWLNGLTASATSVYFALAGYTQDARSRADDLGIPLFVMDLTGMPQPVNDPADRLVSAGA
ncbi:collagen-like protein [Streptomyces sp. NPDC057686]|uniref:collagen-like triple helix repeat-containing protein n=1 Tax=Streptomyces sp. NPDC057686 TaxID=3346212 RepID=UPI003685E662